MELSRPGDIGTFDVELSHRLDGYVRDEDTERGLTEHSTEEGEERKDRTRTKGNQRWMKLRTTVQLSGAISQTIQRKAPLKREDSFLKRFSTRQIPEVESCEERCEERGYGRDDGRGGVGSRGRSWRPRTVRSVVDPDGTLHFYWLLAVSLCVLYNLWTLIVRQAFPELEEAASRVWLSADLLSDAVFLLDILLQLRTGYLEQGLMVYDWRKLARHYLKSKRFALDLLALFPLELLQHSLGPKPILRCPRFLKVYRVYNYYYIVESRTVYPNVWRVANLIHILLILAHWFGCFYYLLSEAEGFQGDWVYPYRPGEYATLARKYLGSLYWSTLTLTTIGDLPTPETNTDRGAGRRTPLSRAHKSRLLRFHSNSGYIFTIVSYLIGVFIFATIVGQVGNVITNRNANRLEFERLLDGAKTYMRQHKVPGGMKRRVLRWYDYSWSRGRIQGGGDINTALGLLPDKLKTELALHVNLSVLKKVTIFQECQPEFLHDLVLKMKAYIFTPGDMICRKGEVAREMFIIADGILEVMSETGRVLTTMKAGDFFGEIGILNLDGLNKRTADVRSVGYSELFSLSREDVLAAMKDYPEAQEILQNLGRKRLMEARSLNRAWRISAQQKKEGKNAGLVGNKTDKTEGDTSNVTNKGSIVGKLRGDVMELRNVFKKSSRNARGKSESIETEMPRHHLEREKESGGLSLLQRIRLLKETEEDKAELQEETLGDSCGEAPGAGIDPALPLLHRILQLKQKEERKGSSTLQNTAQSAAELLATTVRTQLKPPTSLTLRQNQPSRDHGKSVKSSMFFKSKKHHEKLNPAENDSESWTLIKKAVLEASSSFDINTKYREMSENPLSVINSETDSSWENSQENEERVLRKPHTEITVHSDDETRLRSSDKESTTKFYKRRKIYHSIDDLSPEYSGLPFVKKLKILNERQKLAELEKDPMKISRVEMRRGTQSIQTQIDFEVENKPDQIKDIRTSLVLDVANVDENHENEEDIGVISPESNETLERRKLKTLLKKLSHRRTERRSTLEMKRLERAPTLQGYVARHRQLKKSRTVHHNTAEDDSIPTLYSTRSLDSSIVATQYSTQSDSSDDSNLTEIEALQSNRLATANNTSGQSIIEKHNLRENQGNMLTGRNMVPADFLETLAEGIRRTIDDHMMKIESNYINKFSKLESDYKKKEEIITQLERKIEELEGEMREERDGGRTGEEQSGGGVESWSGVGIRQPPPPDLVSMAAVDDSDTSTEDADVFQADWELQLLAVEMERREEASRRRAASFDCSTLCPGPPTGLGSPLEPSAAHLGRKARWSYGPELERPLSARRSLSIHNLQTRRRGTHTGSHPTSQESHHNDLGITHFSGK